MAPAERPARFLVAGRLGVDSRCLRPFCQAAKVPNARSPYSFAYLSVWRWVAVFGVGWVGRGPMVLPAPT